MLTSLLHIQLIRFLFVGALNTIFGYSLFAIFIFVGLHYTAAIVITTCIGVIFNFKTLGALVFRNTNKSLFLNFIAVYVASMFVNILVVRFLLTISTNLYLNGAVGILVAAAVTYALNSKFVFKVNL